MAIQDKVTLKTYFQTNDVPTQTQFGHLIDSFAQLASNGAFEQPWGASPGSSLDLVNVPSIAAVAGYEEHGQFRMWNELHTNVGSGGSGYDYSFAFGFNGNGTATNIALWTQEVSYDPNGTYKTNEHYMTYQHVDATYWPAPLRICWGVTTFSNNRGSIANPFSVGYANLGQVQFSGLQPSVGGSKAGWRYCQLLPNYQTGAMVFELTSHSTNSGTATFTITSTGTVLNTTAGLSVAAAGGTIGFDWSTGGTSTQTLNTNAGTATLATVGVTVAITSPTTYGSGNPGLSVSHTATTSSYAHLELYTKSANQIAAISFSNATTQKWSLFSRGDSSDAFQIYNRTAGSAALAINNSTNEITLTGKLTLTAATTARASLNIPAGTDPTSPNNGEIWFDGTDFKGRKGGVTRTFNMT